MRVSRFVVPLMCSAVIVMLADNERGAPILQDESSSLWHSSRANGVSLGHLVQTGPGGLTSRWREDAFISNTNIVSSIKHLLETGVSLNRCELTFSGFFTTLLFLDGDGEPLRSVAVSRHASLVLVSSCRSDHREGIVLVGDTVSQRNSPLVGLIYGVLVQDNPDFVASERARFRAIETVPSLEASLFLIPTSAAEAAPDRGRMKKQL